MFDGDISDNAVALRSRDVLPVASPKLRAPAAEKPAEKKPEPKPEAAKPEADKGAAKPEDNRPFWRRRPILTVSLLAGTAIVAVAGYVWWDNGSHFETTDDAFIAARQYAVAPKITGYVKSVPVTDNQHVEAGDVIARLDDRDYQAALDQAECAGRGLEGEIDNVEAQTRRADSRRSRPARRRSIRPRRRSLSRSSRRRATRTSPKGRGQRPERSADILAAQPAGRRCEERGGAGTRRRAAARGLEGAAAQRAGQSLGRRGAARSGAAQYRLCDRHRAPSPGASSTFRRRPANSRSPAPV